MQSAYRYLVVYICIHIYVHTCTRIFFIRWKEGDTPGTHSYAYYMFGGGYLHAPPPLASHIFISTFSAVQDTVGLAVSSVTYIVLAFY